MSQRLRARCIATRLKFAPLGRRGYRRCMTFMRKGSPMTSTLKHPVPPRRNLRHIALALLAAAALSACGGGGGSGVVDSPVGSVSNQFANQCAPNNTLLEPGATGIGTLALEKQWVNAYVNEAYLWYNEIPAVNASAANFSNDNAVIPSINAYFDALTTIPKDRFSFTYPTKAWEDLVQRGITLGYGAELVRTSMQGAIPRVYRVAYTEPGSAAAAAGLQRGDTIQSIDGVDINDTSTVGVATINAGLFPSTAGNHNFVFSRNGSALPAVALAAGPVTSTPVPTAKVLDVGGSKVGYLLFNEHIQTAEPQLVAAFNTFKNEGISDLVLDLRYNSGGFLYIASQVGFMVAGAARTDGKVFERLQYNDKRVAENQAINATTGFFGAATSGGALPSLSLARVWVLQGPATCSASESIINGLRGVDVEVRTIGSTTCGKPYGFTARNNCGNSYFPIEFQGVNQKGTGDYASGFVANCSAADDFSKPLGDLSEGMLAAALFNHTNNSCGNAFGVSKGTPVDGALLRGPERSNKIQVDASKLR
jgi:carboxyl-terminal processing protease